MRGTVCSATSGRDLAVQLPNTDTDWAADELTRKSDCSAAKQSLVALSSGEAEVHGIVRAVATSKQTSQIDLGPDRDAT